MRIRSVVLGLLVLLPSLFAGCAKEAPAAPSVASAVPAKISANKGILLRVLVITDEYFPVAAAKVTMIGLGVNGTTDDWGDAFFHVAKAGRYAIHVHRAGFYPNQTRVVLEDGASEATLRVRLRDAPGHAHYADFYYFSGLCGPVVYVKDVSTSSECGETRFFEKPEARFILGRGLVRGFLELSWAPHPAGTNDMRMEVRFPEIGAFADGREVLVAEGPSPVRMILDEGLFTPRHRENGNLIVIGVGLSQARSVNTNVQQSFDIDGEFSYLNEAPDVDPDS